MIYVSSFLCDWGIREFGIEVPHSIADRIIIASANLHLMLPFWMKQSFARSPSFPHSKFRRWMNVGNESFDDAVNNDFQQYIVGVEKKSFINVEAFLLSWSFNSINSDSVFYQKMLDEANKIHYLLPSFIKTMKRSKNISVNDEFSSYVNSFVKRIVK